MLGHLVAGECLGCHFEEKSYTDKDGKPAVFNEVTLGISFPSNSSAPFQERKTETAVISLSKKQIDSGLAERFQSLKGKTITVVLYHEAWVSSKGNAGIRYKLSGNGNPLED
jgi:hypothetical protein